MSMPASIFLAIVLLLLIFAGARGHRPVSVGVYTMVRLTLAFLLAALIPSLFQLFQIIPSILAKYGALTEWLSIACAFGVAVFIARISSRRIRKFTSIDRSIRYWGAFEISLCFMLALNMFFIALPEIRFTWGAISPSGTPSATLWPNFTLFYSDTQRVVLNPIYDLLRLVLAWYTPEYFLIPVSCIYLMALAIAFFCAGTAPLVGYYGGIAMAAGLCWSKEVLLSVFMVTNLVTLLLTVGLSIWILCQTFRAVSQDVTPFRIVRTGLLIGAVALFSLYAYAASRSVSAPFMGAAISLLAWRAARSSQQRVYYLTALCATVVIPVAVLSSVYDGKWGAFISDFRAGVPSMSNIHNSRPAFIDPNIEASTPDLPAYYGALIADIPQQDGSIKRDWVYWYRSPSEFAWVMWSNTSRVLKRYLPFPGGKTAWFFALIGLASSLAILPSLRTAALCLLAIFGVSLILMSPFLIIPAAGDWRRGVAVVLVFASLAGLGVYRATGVCFPRARDSVSALAATLLIFLIFGKESINAIAATPINQLGISMVCTFNPIKPLLSYLSKDPLMTGKILLLGSNEDRCSYSAFRQLNTILGENRVQLYDSAVFDLGQIVADLAPGDSLALHCGPLTGTQQLNLCDELRSSSGARLAYSAPADGNEIWVFTKANMAKNSHGYENSAYD